MLKLPLIALAPAHEVLFRDIGVENKTITAAVTAADLEGSGRPFLYINQQIESVRLIGFFGG